MRKLHLIAFLIISTFATLKSQDLHYSWYQFAPLTVNPAFAGAFSGSYRVSGIYSDKQGAITARNYRTFTLSGDAPIVRGIRKQDWVGVGIELTQLDFLNRSGTVTDQASNPVSPAKDGFQLWNTMKIGLAYHLALDKKQTRIFTLGGQFGNNTRKYSQLAGEDARVGRVFGRAYDKDVADFNKMVAAAGTAGSSGADNKLKIPFRDMTFGVMYNARQKTSDLKLGISVEGLTRAKVGLKKSGNAGTAPTPIERKFIGLNIHGAYEMAINKRVNITPGAYYYSLGPANGLNINAHAQYLLNEEKETKLSFGLGLRNLRALSFYAGGEFKGVKVGFAYDQDLSSATIGSKGVGGFELVGSYIGKIYKKPKVKPEVFCPRL